MKHLWLGTQLIMNQLLTLQVTTCTWGPEWLTLRNTSRTHRLIVASTIAAKTHSQIVWLMRKWSPRDTPKRLQFHWLASWWVIRCHKAPQFLGRIALRPSATLVSRKWFTQRSKEIIHRWRRVDRSLQKDRRVATRVRRARCVGVWFQQHIFQNSSYLTIKKKITLSQSKGRCYNYTRRTIELLEMLRHSLWVTRWMSQEIKRLNTIFSSRILGQKNSILLWITEAPVWTKTTTVYK